jgi:hypothetical protein
MYQKSRAKFSWNSGWYNFIVKGYVKANMLPNGAIEKDKKVHPYRNAKIVEEGDNYIIYELEIDYDVEVAEEGVFSKIMAALIVLGLGAIAFTLLVTKIQEAGGTLAGLGIIAIIILILIAMIWGRK